MIWTYTETHTLARFGHRHARTHSLTHSHTHPLTCIQQPRAHSSRALHVYSMLPIHTRSHSHVYTNTLYKSMCAQTPTHSPLNSLSRTHTLARPRTRSHTLLHVNIVDKPSLNLSIHILLWPFLADRR